jgi:hypothetical protein
MNAIGINDAFHRLVDGGLSAEQAWKKLTTALTSGELRLWCDGNPVALDYLNANVRFILHDGDFVAWPGGGGLGWNPHAYTFTIDGEQFERLLSRPKRGRPPKEVTASDVEQETVRRQSAGRPASQTAVAKALGVGRRTIGRRKKIIAPK